MNFVKKIKKHIELIKLNKNISKYKYIHLMFNDKFNKPFVDFLNKNFDTKKHLILCKRWFQQYPFPEGENVIEIEPTFSFSPLNFDKCDKIICHSLFDFEVIRHLYKHKKLLKKAYWVMWGGDLYEAPRDEKNDFVRKNFKGYLNKIDEDYAKKKYGINAPFYNVHYPFPTITFDNKPINHSANKTIHIQINNSADKSTLEVLDFLEKFKNEDILITTILSYGDIGCKEKIIQKGKEIFGNKFDYLDKFLDSKNYIEFIKKNDILILNQNRQQGVGNLICYLEHGRKEFIKNEVSTYQYLNNIENIKIFDTKEIPLMSFDDFIKNDFAEQNAKKAKALISNESLTKQWESVFND